jgi:beta-RFAP synthase
VNTPANISAETAQLIEVSTPARLHLGFLDLGASLGRRFGSIGLAIASHQTVIQVSAADALTVSGVADKVVVQKITRLAERFLLHCPPQRAHAGVLPALTVRSLIPEHAGLGSGTQLALTVGRALAAFYQLSLSTDEIARIMQRGKRSGIGINTFDHGGFVVDGGLAEHSALPPMLFNRPFPSDWRILLIFDPQYQGVHGETETQAFRQLPDFPQAHSQAICQLTLMQLLPALVEQNIATFGSAVTEIQALIGEHFAPVQGGLFTSPRVAQLVHQARQAGHQGIAQSSWGPTGCVFVDSQAAAEHLQQQLQFYCSQYAELDGIVMHITGAANSGARIEQHAAPTTISQLRSHHG